MPTGVTRNGTVVGFFSGQILQTQAPYVDIFTWQPGAASLSNIVTIGPADCGIGCLLRPFLNNSDMIAFTGFGDTATNSNKVFFGPAGGTVQQISGLASDAVATGLTNENLVVGTETSGTASPISVFFNFRHGVVTLHRPPGSRYVGNVTANDKGLVAGSYQGTDGTAHIFTWQAGRYTVLPLPPGISDISVYAMNNKGRLVGICLDALDGLQHLFLHNGTEFTLIPQGQLPYLGHYSIFRLLINDENVIVYSFYGDYNDFGSYRILCAGTGC